MYPNRNKGPGNKKKTSENRHHDANASVVVIALDSSDSDDNTARALPETREEFEDELPSETRPD